MEKITNMLKKQARQRQQLLKLLGDLPDRSVPIVSEKIHEAVYDSYVLEKIILNLNGIEAVPAYFVRPKKFSRPLPVMLYNHAHGGQYDIGKEELIKSRVCLQNPPYAKILTDMGIAALCIDTWAFGERAFKSESYIFKRMLWNGQIMWGMMIYDSLRAVDYLVSRPDIDKNRIATMGMSMGSTMAWWLAALDLRIKVCIDICCLTDFEEFLRAESLEGHGLYYYVPGLLKHFTTAQINELITPRPHLSLAGKKDGLTPIEGLKKIDNNLKVRYSAFNALEAWKLIQTDTGHEETPLMRNEVIKFLQQWL
ncbi:MAG: alpha/beta hydrolase family protein [Sedimentisphaerales bacterium]